MSVAAGPGKAPGEHAGPWTALPLFPLQSVLFPGGLLQLRVFEARYLDLVSQCLRSGAPFAVVRIRQGQEVRSAGSSPKTLLEDIGVLAHLQEVDAEQPGILRVRCVGGQRVHLGALQQRADGLWLAEASVGEADAPAAVPAELAASARALAQAIESLRAQDQHPFLLPHRLDDAGWVANRWCEILPISAAARQRLMALDEPVLRLKLVQEYLHGKGLV